MPHVSNPQNITPVGLAVFFLMLLGFIFLILPSCDLTAAEMDNSTQNGENLPVWDAEKVTILTNQAPAPVRFWIEEIPGGERVEKILQRGDTAVISNPQAATAVFEYGTELVQLQLAQDEIYLFAPMEGKLELLGIGPNYPGGKVPSRLSGKHAQTETSSRNDAFPTLTIPVVIYMDESIPMAVAPWEKRVRERVAEASAILEKTCFTRLEIQEFKPWQSDPKCENLGDMLKDFEKKASVPQGVLAIGFTANRHAQHTRMELGVARQPFHGPILLREEAPQITEVERLETLLHEMGHFLGAVHTSDENSVMRTVMRERHARDVNFTISFDPLNALAMNLWVRQFLRGDRKRVRTIDPDVVDGLEAVYRLVQRIAEDQKAAGMQVLENPNVDIFLKILEKMRELHRSRLVVSVPRTSLSPILTPAQPLTPENMEITETVKTPENSGKTDSILEPAQIEEPKKPAPKVEVTTTLSPEVLELQKMMREMTATPWETEKTDELELPIRTARYVVVRTLLALAQEEPLRNYDASGKQAGDVKGEKIIRYAAWAALEVGGTGTADSPEGKAARGAFLLACHLFLEPSGAVGKIPVYGRRFRVLETPEIKKLRRKIVGNDVSVFGRQDHSQHFWLSAALSVQIVPEIVENIGVEKELNDDRDGGSGFDVTDLNADIAGVWFGNRVMRGLISLEDVGRKFEYTRVVPSQIRIPKRLKHPKDTEEIQELVQKLREAVHELQKEY